MEAFRLKDIRIINGYTVEKLADKVMITKQSVSKYELGKTTPSAGVLRKMQDLFYIPRGYLTKKDMLPADKSEIYHGQSGKPSKKELELAQIYLKWSYEIVIALDEFDPIKKMEWIDTGTCKTSDEIAESVRRNWGLGNTPIEDMAVLLKKHGCYLFTAPIKDKKIDAYSQVFGDYPIIIADCGKGLRRKAQFTLAKQLGHFLMHRDIKEPDSEMLGQMKLEAEEFAACFLVPEAELKADFIRRDLDSIMQLADKWRVSPEIMIERCRATALLDDNSAVALLRRLHRKKVKIVEDDVLSCTMRDELIEISNSQEKSTLFFRILCLPQDVVCRISSLQENTFDFAQELKPDNPDDIVGVQLSFDFYMSNF